MPGHTSSSCQASRRRLVSLEMLLLLLLLLDDQTFRGEEYAYMAAAIVAEAVKVYSQMFP
jgi:type II secretory pathway component PulL